MNSHDKSELLAAIALASFGSFVVYEALGLPYSSEFGPGPGFFPLWIGIGIVVCALVMIWTTSLRRDTGSAEVTSKPEMARSLGAWAAFVLAIALLSVVGFTLSLAVLTVYLVVVLDRRSFWVGLGVAVGLAFAFHLVFVVALGVSLPVGPLGF
jgi:putative tricarboxylic transport membrane protein